MKTLNTAEEFKNAEPGMYRVEGEAAEELAKQFGMSVDWSKRTKVTIKNAPVKRGIVQRVKDAIAERKAKKEERRMKAGYTYAAATLLRHGDVAIAALCIHIDNSKTFGTYDAFDKGMDEALKDFKLLQLSMF